MDYNFIYNVKKTFKKYYKNVDFFIIYVIINISNEGTEDAVKRSPKKKIAIKKK